MLIANKHLGLMVAIAVGLGLGSSSRASLLATDPDSIPAFTGSEAFSSNATDGSGDMLRVVVDYAVFKPGAYPGSLITGADPSAGNDYVYTYLVNNEAAANVQLTTFSVVAPPISGAHNAGQNNSLGGQAPLAQSLTSSSFQHLYDGIAPGSSSNITLFTSPNPPTFGSASVGDGGLSDQESLPTPTVPEPASLGLLAAAGVMAFGRRRKQDHR